MKFLFDFFPILLFFIAYKTFDIFVATAVAIGASFIQVSIYWLKHRRFENMHLITLGLLVVLGGATLWFRNPEFIMWKVTAINWLFALVILGSQFIGEKPIIRRMLDAQIELPEPVWLRLNLMWSAFFAAVGAVNVYFALNAVRARALFFDQSGLDSDSVITDFDCAADFASGIATLCQNAQGLESTWVDFKFYGVLGLTLLFVLVQGVYLARHMPDEAADGDETDTPSTPGATPEPGTEPRAKQTDEP